MDEVDFGPEYSELRELFPQVRSKILLDVLDQFDDDVEKATEHLLSGSAEAWEKVEQHEPDYEDDDFKLAQLVEMFPDVPSTIVKRLFNESQSDVERTTEAILEHQMLRDVEEKLRLEDERERRNKQMKAKKSKHEWNSLGEKIEILVELTGLKIQECRSYIHQNSGKVPEAVVDIMMHYRDEKEKIKEMKRKRDLKPVTITSSVPEGGRVQGGHNVRLVPRYGLTLKEKEERKRLRRLQKTKNTFLDLERAENPSDSDSESTGSTAPTDETISEDGAAPITAATSTMSDDDSADESDDEKVYIFDENNAEALELASLVFEDKQLVQISWEFYKKSLIFFKGTISKVVACAIFLVEHNAAELTWKDVNKALDYTTLTSNASTAKATIPANTTSSSAPAGEFKPVVKKKQTTTAQLRRLPRPTDPSTEEGLNKNQIRRQRQGLSAALKYNNLDLHGFHVKNAKVTVTKALEKWWADEMEQREIEGKVDRSHKARMIPPLLIITGRGIHSDGGVSKVRHSVKALLDRNGWIYKEDASRFSVIGKKS